LTIYLGISVVILAVSLRKFFLMFRIWRDVEKAARKGKEKTRKIE
jgi:hypothetical protein